MPRKRRQDYAGATHHVFMRGVARSAVAVDDADYERALFLLDRAVSRFEIGCHAWCFLPNHSHLVLTSKLGNLSKAMHWFGTCFAQSFNRRHERSGHLYQGRFGSKVITNDTYLLELARYLPLNPVRAGLCAHAEEWPWSSFGATAGLRTPPSLLDASPFLDVLGTTGAYAAWVGDGLLSTFLDEHGTPRPPRKPLLAEILLDNSDQAIASAHFKHGYSHVAIAKHLGVSRAQIGRRLR